MIEVEDQFETALKETTELEVTVSEIWALYPKRGGREEGRKSLFILLCEESAEHVRRATLNFVEAMRLEGREEKFIMAGTRFYGTDEWRDYLKDAPKVTMPSGEISYTVPWTPTWP